MRRLDGVLGGGVGLVCAPAGYGKTTLLASWARSLRSRADVVWLTLQPEHEDPAVLGEHLRVSARSVLPGVEASGLAGVLSALASSTLASTRPVLLIIDDAHAVPASASLFTAIRQLVDRGPPKLLVTIGSREDPPIGVARLRARGDLVEVRADDLSFDLPETRALLDRRFGIVLREGEEALLRRITEGWVAGLCLSGFALQIGDDPSRLLGEGLGDHRYFREFFDSEVLGALSPDHLLFMERTSVLDRLDSSLCDLLTGRSDSLSLLRTLAARNLFTEESSVDPESFRYHPLLAERLRARLVAHRPEEAARLLDTASRWYEEQGRADAAIEMAFRNGDHDRVEQLIREACGPAIRSGYAATVVRWLSHLPADALARSPELHLVMGRASGLVGDIVAARAAANEVSAAMTGMEGPVPPGLLIGRYQLESSLRFWEGSVFYLGESLDEFMTAYEEHPDDPVVQMLAIDRESMLVFLALAHLLAGEWSKAVELADDALRIAHVLRPTRYTILGLGIRATAFAWAGDEPRGREAVRQGFSVLRSFAGPASEPFLLHVAAAWVGEGANADEEAELAHAIASRVGIPVFRATAGLTVARVSLREGRPGLARHALSEAEQALEIMSEPGVLAALKQRLDSDLEEAHPDEIPELGSREIELLAAIGRGATRRQAAEDLNLSVNTVKTHLRSAYRKLGARDREEAVTMAQRLGLITKSRASAGDLRQPTSPDEADLGPPGCRLSNNRG